MTDFAKQRLSRTRVVVDDGRRFVYTRRTEA